MKPHPPLCWMESALQRGCARWSRTGRRARTRDRENRFGDGSVFGSLASLGDGGRPPPSGWRFQAESPHCRIRQAAAQSSDFPTPSSRRMGDEAGKNGRARLGSARWSGRARAKTVATRYRLDSGPPSFQKTWVDRVRDKKNRAVQRVLVCCRLATASKDTFFKLKKKENHAAIKRLRAIRKGVVQHTERILELGIATRRFANNTNSVASTSNTSSSSSSDAKSEQCHGLPFLDAAQTIESQSYAFQAKVNAIVVTQFDNEIAALEEMRGLMNERAKLLVDVDYAERKLALDQQRGNINRIADRKRNLQLAQLHYRRAAKTLLDQILDTDSKLELVIRAVLDEYSRLMHQYFTTSSETLCVLEDARSAGQDYKLL